MNDNAICLCDSLHARGQPTVGALCPRSEPFDDPFRHPSARNASLCFGDNAVARQASQLTIGFVGKGIAGRWRSPSSRRRQRDRQFCAGENTNAIVQAVGAWRSQLGRSAPPGWPLRPTLPLRQMLSRRVVDARGPVTPVRVTPAWWPLRGTSSSTSTAPLRVGCGSNGVTWEGPDLLMIWGTALRQGLRFRERNRAGRPGRGRPRAQKSRDRRDTTGFSRSAYPIFSVWGGS